MALFIYKLDVKKRYPKETIKNEYGEFINRTPEVRFDLDNMDMGKKGQTRYYPFSVNGKSFIMKMFLASEYVLQPKIPKEYVLYQDTTSSGEIMFQVLPGINKILEDCKIKPNDLYPSSEVNSSP